MSNLAATSTPRVGSSSRSTRDECERYDDPAETRHRADAEIEVAHRHDDRHRRGYDHEHAHLLGDVEKVARSEERRGKTKREVDENERGADEGSVPSEKGCGTGHDHRSPS